MSLKQFNRRQFLGSCGKMSSISLLSSVLQLKMTNSVLAANATDLGGYKAMVCVFLNGGNDSFNMLIPRESGEHQNYMAVRGDKGISLNDAHSIMGSTKDGFRRFAIHPKMPEVAQMFNSSELNFVANVGTLVRPTTLNDYTRNNHLPRALFSHFEQQLSWQTSVPEKSEATGWIGRMSEMINDNVSNNPDFSMNVSTSGVNRLQTGHSSAPFITSGRMRAYHGNVKEAIDASLLRDYQNTLQDHFNHTRKTILEQSNIYQSAISGVSLRTAFPNTSLGNQLKQVAIAISQRQTLGRSRQTFFVQAQGYDSHFDLIKSQDLLLPELSQALKAFNSAMKELGVINNVVTYTASDFGRSLAGNGTGTDHGWGGNQIIMGPVNPRRVSGAYPDDLSLGANTDIGRGRQLPTTSVDQMHAELACWYGVQNNSDMTSILPNIRNFWGANRAPELAIMR